VCVAAKYGNTEVARCLCLAGARIDAKNREGVVAEVCARVQGHASLGTPLFDLPLPPPVPFPLLFIYITCFLNLRYLSQSTCLYIDLAPIFLPSPPPSKSLKEVSQAMDATLKNKIRKPSMLCTL
jgi:hypothetical protein